MTLLIVTFDPESGEVTETRHESDHDYSPGDDELIVDHGDHQKLAGKMVNTSTDPPTLVDDPEAVWKRPGVVDKETFDVIVEQYRAAGSDAINAEQAIAANSNIPQEVEDFARAAIQMQYLVYVTLTGDRITSVEDEYFPV